MKNRAVNTVLFEKAIALGLPKGKFALFGSAPMGIRGIKECHDIDIAMLKQNVTFDS